MPQDSLDEYQGRFPETPYTGRGRGAGYPLDYGAQETPKAAIAAMITRMDRSVGAILDLLGELGIEGRTIVFFTSDNGASGGPGAPEFFNATGGLRGLKGSLYEGGIRVPFLVRWPRTVEAGSVSDHPVYFADVMPTLAALAGVGDPSNTDGLSMLPTLVGTEKSGQSQEKHGYLYWNNNGLQAVRMGKWKAVTGRGIEGIELYDLEQDPGETTDIASSRPEIVEQIRKHMEAAYSEPRPQVEPEKPESRQYQ